MIRRSWVQTPLGQLLLKFNLVCVTLDLSDNLTEMHIVKNKIMYANIIEQIQNVSVKSNFGGKNVTGSRDRGRQ